MPATNVVAFQMPAGEVIRTAFRRKVPRPRFLAAIAVVLVIGIALIAAKNSAMYFGLVCVAYAALAPLGLYLAVRRLVAQSPWLTAPITFGFGDSGITITAPDRRFEVAWSGFRSWSQTRDHMFLYIDAGNAAVTIPRRAFSTEQLQRFMGYVTRIAG
jgi:hypothetical protein